MKIFITGASGFLGGAIAGALKFKHELLAMSRSEKSDGLLSKFAKPVRCDLADITGDHLRGTDVVVHCAAFVGPWGTREEYWKGNVDGTERVLESAAAAGVKRFIHMSTEAVLFAGQDMVDVDETYPYPERTPYLYSETKGEAERRVLRANRPGFETIVLRPRLVWGPGDTSVLPVLAKMVREGRFLWIDGGRSLTSTTCIPNLVHAVELALTKGTPGRIYFIADRETHTFREFLTRMLATQGIAIPGKSVPGFLARGAARIVEGLWRLFRIRKEPPLMRFATDVMTRQCTVRTTRAELELGYSPLVTFVQGLSAMESGTYGSALSEEVGKPLGSLERE
jgi:nucleoside-diphosphate-sugar epimerase